MLTETHDYEEIIDRVAALDIGKAEPMCWVRVPSWSRSGSCSPTPAPATLTPARTSRPGASTPTAAAANTSASSKPWATPLSSNALPDRRAPETRPGSTALRRVLPRAPNCPIFGLARGHGADRTPGTWRNG